VILVLWKAIVSEVYSSLPFYYFFFRQRVTAQLSR
jgi:hypothetical protein